MSKTLLVRVGFPLLLIVLTLISVRLKRPKLERTHLVILGVWAAAWVGVFSYWLSHNGDGGFIRFGVFLTLLGLIAGFATIALIGFVAQAIFAGTTARSLILLTVPLLIVGWYYVEANEPWEGTTTGIVPGHIPEGWVWHGSTGDAGNSYDAYIYVDDTDPDRPPDEDRLLIIGVRREPRDYPTGTTVTRNGRSFGVFEEAGHFLVVENLGAVTIEVSSNGLPEETLLKVAERVHYDPESDAGAK